MKEAYEAWKKMHAAAAKDGVNLIIISATRNFDYQKGIWERKWNDAKYKGKTDTETALNILKYSSMPGTSRHHWGTDVDFNSVTPSYFTSGNGKKVYTWLLKNAATYGFEKMQQLMALLKPIPPRKMAAQATKKNIGIGPICLCHQNY